MKQKTYTYSTDCEVNAITCDLNGVEILICPTQENELKITLKNAKDPDICCNESRLRIKLHNRLSVFKRKKAGMTLYVPDHTLPDIGIICKACDVKINGGIYGQLALEGDGCEVEFSTCAFNACSLLGTTLSTKFSDVTVKNTLVVKCDSGNMIWENSFASCTECRVKKGNIGLSGFTCKDSILEAENGNVAAHLNGNESDYNLGLLAKEGTSNRESVTHEGAVRTFKAYSAKGSIAVDFVPEDNLTYGGM